MALSWPITLAMHIGIGSVGGFAAAALGAPMPFLLGALCAVAPLVIWQSAAQRPTLQFPKPLRLAFIAVIGTMIGAGFSPELFNKLPTIWMSLLLVPVFVIVAHAFGYVLYRRVGGYDRPTALYGSMPGGLIEGVTLGEQAGGNVMLLTVHHFARVVLVVVCVPLLFAALSGEIVGSASGANLDQETARWSDLAGIVAVSGVGYALGKLFRLPAGHLMGPLVLAAALGGSGIAALETPEWLLSIAQLIIGTALATQFAGAQPKILVRAFGLTAVMVAGMFTLSAACAVVVSSYSAMPFDAAFISFAPGGVAEMGLIALSLDASPVLVTMHHLVRIVLTVVLVRLADPALAKRGL